MPLCHLDTTITPQSCTASGNYRNDDGETIDPAKMKRWNFNYNHNISATAGAAPDTMKIDVTFGGYNGTINGNDHIKSIQIYDATHLNMSSATYDVTATVLSDDGS